MWALEDQTSIRPKNRGTGLMVSDFIDEYCGCLRLTDDEYTLFRRTHPNIKRQLESYLDMGRIEMGIGIVVNLFLSLVTPLR